MDLLLQEKQIILFTVFLCGITQIRVSSAFICGGIVKSMQKLLVIRGASG
jgi:hypothetical protein